MGILALQTLFSFHCKDSFMSAHLTIGWLFYQIFRVASRTSACLLHPSYSEYAFTLIFRVNHFVPFAIINDTSPYYDKVHFATWSSLFVFAYIPSFSDAGLASVP